KVESEGSSDNGSLPAMNREHGLRGQHSSPAGVCDTVRSVNEGRFEMRWSQVLRRMEWEIALVNRDYTQARRMINLMPPLVIKPNHYAYAGYKSGLDLKSWVIYMVLATWYTLWPPR